MASTLIISEPSPSRGRKLTTSQVIDLVFGAGLRGDAAAEAVAVAYAVSDYTPTFQNRLHKLSVTEVGLWGVRSGSPTKSVDLSLLDPYNNTRAMLELSGGVSNWEPWGFITDPASNPARATRYKGVLPTVRRLVEVKNGYRL